MVKTCEVKVDKDTHTVEYDDEEYEKLIYEVTRFAKEGRNAFKCIHCMAKFTSKQRLNYHRLKGCHSALDINGKPLELKLYPSMPSGGAAEVKEILEKCDLLVRNAFNCIHCSKECESEQQLDYHRSMCSPGVPDINGQPSQQKLFPSVPSVEAAEVRDILEKPNLHRVCELEESDQLVRNAFNCIHCSKECESEQQLDYHCSMCSPGVPDINGQPSQQKLFPSVPSVGAAEVRDILEKPNLHRVCELEESDQLVRNAFNCIHCSKECESEQQLDYHRSTCSPGVPDINGQPSQQKLFPSVPSVGAAEVRDILEKPNLHRVCELEESDQLVRNAFNCIHCSKECESEQQLDYHRSTCSPGVPDINGQPSQQKLFPSVPSVGAAEVRDILEKPNLHRVCELEESNQLASFGEDVLLQGSPSFLWEDWSELSDALCVTSIVYKEHPESHEASSEFRDISEKQNFHGVCEPEERDQLASFGEDILPHGSPLQLLCKDGSELPEALCVTPIVYKEHPDSHEVSFLVMDGLSFSPAFVYQEELDKEGLSIYQGKGLFDFLRHKANKALFVVSVTKLEDCIPAIAPLVYTHLTACKRLDYPKIYSVIVDRIVENPDLLAANTRMVQIEDVPATIWAPMIGLDIAGMRVTNIIIMGRHEDCTTFHEAEGERWISWGEKGCLEGDWKGLSLWEHKKYVEWVQDLLWNCNKLILSRRELIPKSVVPSCFPSVFNSLDGCQDMHNLKEVLVTQRAKSKDSSKRNKKSFANVPPGGGEGRERRFGNSGGNEDVINITKRQQFTRLVRLTCEELHLRLSLEWWYTMSSRWYQDLAIVALKYVVWLDKTYLNSPLRPRLDILQWPPHFLKWPDSLDELHQAYEFEMMRCSQKIVAPWVQWQTPPSEQNVRE